MIRERRTFSSERTKLETVIPLETPFVLFLDPSSVCNLACKFCPCGNAHRDLWDENKKTSIMSYELFRKIINDCKDFPQKIKVLRLYKEGEPLVNRRLPDMVRYAKDSGVAESIDFTTNGVLLNHDLSLSLIDAGIDRINISIEALSPNEYKNICGVHIDFEKFFENLEFLYKNRGKCHIFLKTTDKSLGDHDETEFYKMFGDVCDGIDVEKVASVWPEFDLGNDYKEIDKKNMYGEDLFTNLVCPYIFYQACINSDGSVSCCLMDWNHKQIVGNVMEDSIVKIWSDKKINTMRIENLSGNRYNIEMCKDCGQLKFGGRVDNIDEFRSVLLPKVQKWAGKKL